MIVTIDGPAGAGKSSVARRLAAELGFEYLDTGAMYRAVALACVERSTSLGDVEAVAGVAGEMKLQLKNDRVWVDGSDVTDSIRSMHVTSLIHYVADNPAVRWRLVELQRNIAAQVEIVTEGRDQGTVAFPDAECKFFLTASPTERARRRLSELELRGETTTFEELLLQQEERDQRDATRPVGALVKAVDAVEIVTDGLTLEETVKQLKGIVEARQN
ncbi:MAG: (d)CMP kinase [Pirellulaceae bacterium]|nr:(d)CMP kinase [Pirellulaceae bacterium]